MVLVAAVPSGEDGAVSTAHPKDHLRILALGDSYTIGESVEEAGRWPVQLARALEDGGWPSVEVEIVATTGWTTSELGAGIDEADPPGPYGLVTLLIGVNNQYRGCLLYTSPSPRDLSTSRMPSSA